MTKTQQKLAEQTTIFLNSGGRAITAVFRILLLTVAVLFEAIGLLLSGVEDLMPNTGSEAERDEKRTEKFTLAPLQAQGPRLAGSSGTAASDESRDLRPDNRVPAALFTGTVGALSRRK
jgi:hypothetical protein